MSQSQEASRQKIDGDSGNGGMARADSDIPYRHMDVQIATLGTQPYFLDDFAISEVSRLGQEPRWPALEERFLGRDFLGRRRPVCLEDSTTHREALFRSLKGPADSMRSPVNTIRRGFTTPWLTESETCPRKALQWSLRERLNLLEPKKCISETCNISTGQRQHVGLVEGGWLSKLDIVYTYIVCTYDDMRSDSRVSSGGVPSLNDVQERA